MGVCVRVCTPMLRGAEVILAAKDNWQGSRVVGISQFLSFLEVLVSTLTGALNACKVTFLGHRGYGCYLD